MLPWLTKMIDASGHEHAADGRFGRVAGTHEGKAESKPKRQRKPKGGSSKGGTSQGGKQSHRERVTLSPEFKKWFGDSKVVDENGEPLVVYHGTYKEFDTFDTTGGSDLGSHFGSLQQSQDFNKPEGGRTIPVYLSIKNPLRLPDLERWNEESMVPVLKEHGIDVKMPKREYVSADMAANYMHNIKLKRQAIAKALEDAGYDGIVYANSFEGGGEKGKGDAADSYIVFSPHQIKSATGNRGTFDPNDADITKSLPWLVTKAGSFTGVSFGKYYINGRQVDRATYMAQRKQKPKGGKRQAAGPPPNAEGRYPSRHDGVDYGHEDDRDSDDRHIGRAKRRFSKAKADADSIRANLAAAEAEKAQHEQGIAALQQRHAELTAKIAALKGKPQVQPAPQAKPQPRQASPSTADTRHNPDLDDVWNAPSATPKPQAPAGDMRANPALEEFMASGPGINTPMPQKPTAKPSTDLFAQALGRPSAAKTTVETPKAPPQQAKPQPPPIPPKRQPPPLPPKPQPAQPPALPHQRTQQAALKAANAVRTAATPEARKTAHEHAKQAIDAHLAAGLAHIDRLAESKYGRGPRARMPAFRAKRAFRAKIAEALKRLERIASGQVGKAFGGFVVPMPELGVGLPWLVVKEAGRWITIGGTKGDDGKRRGGSPVYIENGKITRGHPSLTGKKIDALDKPAEDAPKKDRGREATKREAGADRAAQSRRENRESLEYAKARWRKDARKVGHDPKHLEGLANEIKQHHDAFASERKEVLQRAREAAKHFGSDLQRRGKDSLIGGREDNQKAIDQVIATLHAEGYGHHFSPETGEHGSHEDQLRDMLSSGNPEPMDWNDAYRQAFDMLGDPGKHDDPKHAPEPDYPPDWDEPIPKRLRLPWLVKSAEFESKHPRADDGRFGDKAGEHEGKTFAFPASHTTGEFEAVLHDHDTHYGFSRADGDATFKTKIPKDQFNEFVNDLRGKVLAKSESTNESINAVLSQKAKFLGRGNDGLAFDAGDGNVVKVASDVPFHWNNGIRQKGEGSERLKNSVKINEQLRKDGVGGLLPQKLVEHEGRAFAVMPKVDTEAKLTERQFGQLVETIKAMHAKGVVLGDDVQAGVMDGKAYIYDLGAAKKSNDKRDKDDDESRLSRLAEQHGIEFESLDPHAAFDNAIQDAESFVKRWEAKNKTPNPSAAKFHIERLSRLRKHVADDTADLVDYEGIIRRLSPKEKAIKALVRKGRSHDVSGEKRDELGRWTAGGASDVLELKKDHIKDVVAQVKQEIMKHDSSMIETQASALAGARILNSISQRAWEHIERIDQKVKEGKDITDDEDDKYIRAQSLRRELYGSIANESGYRPHEFVDEHPIAKVPIDKPLSKGKSIRLPWLTKQSTAPVPNDPASRGGDNH